MTFSQQLLATLIGTFAGFCGSLILFGIKEAFQYWRKGKVLINNLSCEFDYNINLLNKHEAILTECLEKIAAESKTVYCSIEYTHIARFFAIQFYSQGLLFKYLHSEDMKRWNDSLAILSVGSETYVLETLDKWRKSEIAKSEASLAVEQERKNVRYAREMYVYLKQKINK